MAQEEKDQGLLQQLLSNAITGGLAYGLGSMLPEREQRTYGPTFLHQQQSLRELAMQQEQMREQRRQRNAQMAIEIAKARGSLAGLPPEMQGDFLETYAEGTNLPKEMLAPLFSPQPPKPTPPGVLGNIASSESLPSEARQAALGGLGLPGTIEPGPSITPYEYAGLAKTFTGESLADFQEKIDTDPRAAFEALQYRSEALPAGSKEDPMTVLFRQGIAAYEAGVPLTPLQERAVLVKMKAEDSGLSAAVVAAQYQRAREFAATMGMFARTPEEKARAAEISANADEEAAKSLDAAIKKHKELLSQGTGGFTEDQLSGYYFKDLQDKVTGETPEEAEPTTKVGAVQTQPAPPGVSREQKVAEFRRLRAQHPDQAPEEIVKTMNSAGWALNLGK